LAVEQMKEVRKQHFISSRGSCHPGENEVRIYNIKFSVIWKHWLFY